MKKVTGILTLLIVVMAITAILDPKFREPYNLMNIARWTGMYGILTIGVAFVIITGGIDLSVGSVVGLVGCLMPIFMREMEMPLWQTLVLIGLISVSIGFLHGWLITKLRLQPFVVTLCGLFIYRGIARYITSDATKGFGSEFQYLQVLTKEAPFSIPMPFIFLLLVAMAAAILLNLTVYGRYLLAVGRNEGAARYSGINTDRTVLMTYMIASTLAGFAGILFAVDLNSIQPSGHGNFYELYAIAGAVLGGCSLRGGEGSILGVVIGTAILRVLYNAINILGIATQLEFAVVGLVILAGVIVDEVAKRVAATRRAAHMAGCRMQGTRHKIQHSNRK